MLIEDVENEIKHILVDQKVSVTKAIEGICSKSRWYRAFENKTFFPTCIVEVLERIGYDVEIRIVKR